MTLPQFGIFAQGTDAHEFLEFELRPDVDLSAVGDASCERLRMPAVAAGGVNLVLGFGADLWRALDPDDAPDDLAPFQPVGVLGGHHAPAIAARPVAVDQRRHARRGLRARPGRRADAGADVRAWPPTGPASSIATAAT